MKRFVPYWAYVKLTGLIAIPVVLLCLPATFFDEGQSVCLSVLLADMECYGCGMTRAIMHLIHFEPEVALAYNKLSVVVLPVLAYLWGQELYQEFSHIRLVKEKKQGYLVNK